MKYLMTALFGAALAFTVSTAKAEEKTIEGTMCCEKCCLKTADACADALQADGVTYLLEENGKRKTSAHQCSGKANAKVTGKVEERDGKKFIVVSKIEKEG
ncbi:MAG: hypothetical protein KDM64_00640 [Verrucomicrobiae bacterium]|nr:hypothetical protein [Verrucomicrobiae bacterium]